MLYPHGEPLLPSTSSPLDRTHPSYSTAPEQSSAPLSALVKPSRYHRRATRRHYVEVESDDGDEAMQNGGDDYAEPGEVARTRRAAIIRSRRSTAKPSSRATIVGESPQRTKRICIAVACIRCKKAGRKCSEGRPCDRCRQRGYTDCRDAPRLRQSSSNAGSVVKATKKIKPETHKDVVQGHSAPAQQVISPTPPSRSPPSFSTSPVQPAIHRLSKPGSPCSSLDDHTPPSFPQPPSPISIPFLDPRFVTPDDVPDLKYPNPITSPHLPPLICRPLISPIDRQHPHNSTWPTSRSYEPTLKLPSIRSLFFSGEGERDDVHDWKQKLFDESLSCAPSLTSQARFRISFERTTVKSVRG
ncbi:BQ2448_6546 [Microbotryum intermedium]|uniref:BQ2448_6546 protein n=1 Tax=Microbotryum intermedium TaxID=269621 RepID=A0A238FQF1_9BASI|nr:BQ2448_6546 [Microbotryum intermedium]